MKLDIKIDRRDLISLAIRSAIAIGVAYIIYLGYSFYKEYGRSNRCIKNCSEYRSQLIESQCFCSTDFGWIRSGQVERTINKLKSTCETKPSKRSRRK